MQLGSKIALIIIISEILIWIIFGFKIAFYVILVIVGLICYPLVLLFIAKIQNDREDRENGRGN